jgi:O-antigen biosynthesis protein
LAPFLTGRSSRRPSPILARLAAEPLISVIVATRNRTSSLARCLDSLLAQNYFNYEIVVVDNAPSTSDTADLVRGRYAGRVIYKRDDRPGLGEAHNHALKDNAAPIVAFTDDDVLVDPNWLPAIARNFGDERVGCVTGLILPAELETRAQLWTEKHGGFGKGFERRVYDLKENHPKTAIFPFAAGQLGSGANMSYRTSALRKIGGFDSALGAGTKSQGGDDLAAFYGIIRAGYQLVYEPQAIVWHHHRREEAGMHRQAFAHGMGLSAYLTKVIVDRPGTLVAMARAFPAGARHLLSSSSPKNSRLPSDYPVIMVWKERLGILAGVWGYFRSRAALRRPIQQITT